MANREFCHTSVLLSETVDALEVKNGGIYLDGTCGGGGHSAQIVERGGRVFGIDLDPSAVEHLKNKFKGQSAFSIICGNFLDSAELLKNSGIDNIDGAVLDLGVSSHQLDSAERGFSYRLEGELDMRMNTEIDFSAMDVVNGYSERELARILYEYGEERYSRRIARSIVEKRKNGKITTTTELSSIIQQAVPHRPGAHPAKKTFQAIRIEVNNELDILRKALSNIFNLLNPAGRFCVITFHSLEDRIVKQYFKSLAAGCICDKSIPVCICGNSPKATLIKKQKAGAEEVKANPRSRSATLRVIQKL